MFVIIACFVLIVSLTNAKLANPSLTKTEKNASAMQLQHTKTIASFFKTFCLSISDNDGLFLRRHF